MIALDLGLFDSALLVRYPFALGEGLSPDPRSETSRTDSRSFLKDLRAMAHGKSPRPASKVPGGSSGASVDREVPAQLLRIESP